MGCRCPGPIYCGMTARCRETRSEERAAGCCITGRCCMRWICRWWPGISENRRVDRCIEGVEGAIVANGPRCHLYYTGPFHNHEFKNFELKVDVKTLPSSNGGIYFHTVYQEKNWPDKGFVVQVNNSHTDWRRTGGLYAVVDNKEKVADDEKWFTEHIIVKDNHVTIVV